MFVPIAFLALFLNLGIAPVSGIAGSTATLPNLLPYNVALYFDKNNNDTNLCGGSLIRENWVLTSAECVDNAISAKVILGAFNITDSTESSQVILNSTKFIKHPEFNSTNFYNNVGLVKLPKKITLTDEIQVIELSEETRPIKFFGKEVFISGWGQTSPTSDYTSGDLMRLKVDIIDNYFGQLIWGNDVTGRHLCTDGSPYEGEPSGICSGDHGSPMVYGVYQKLQVAIASYGYGTRPGKNSNGTLGSCTDGKPSVYTLVGPYWDWIRNKTLTN